MSDNPLELTPEREHRIRERAYHLWEADGRPHGRDLDYWERARELIGMEENPGSGLLPIRRRITRSTRWHPASWPRKRQSKRTSASSPPP